MDNEHQSIHEFDFEMITEYYSNLERQGPGSPEVTIKALSFIDNLTSESQIVDIGCGSGSQTMVLAENTSGAITGIDLSHTFIDIFLNKSIQFKVQDRVRGVVGSMENLSFENETLDLIWSEGAIYNIGFERGINEWNRFIKHGGYLAVSEASWFTEERPSEIEEYWKDAYPEIDTISNKVSQIQKAGYVPIANFVLPEDCWIKNFYDPQVSVQKEFLKKYAGNKTAEMFVESERHEAKLYNKYKEYYGYVFYIMKKI